MTSAAPGTAPSATTAAALGDTPDPAGGGVPGTTEVLAAVVQKVTAFAAREIPGVVRLGGGAARAVGAVRQTLTGSTENTAGVRVVLEDATARIGLDVEIEYGAGARQLVRALRRHVPTAVEEILGVTVVELDVVITDVHLPGAEVEPGPGI